jgi:hypothetical protein
VCYPLEGSSNHDDHRVKIEGAARQLGARSVPGCCVSFRATKFAIGI